LHAVCAGQSPALLQPQVLAMHAWPCALVVQSAQLLPATPQALLDVPLWQVPPAQQVLLQTRPPAQLALH
jgi:hypothetical protein